MQFKGRLPQRAREWCCLPSADEKKTSPTERGYHPSFCLLGENLNGNKLYVNRRVGNEGKFNTKSVKEYSVIQQATV